MSPLVGIMNLCYSKHTWEKGWRNQPANTMPCYLTGKSEGLRLKKLHACVIRTVPVERISKMPRQNSNISQIQDMLLASFGRNCSIFQQLVSCAQSFYSLSLRIFNLRWIGPWMWCETALGPCAWVRHTWEPCPRHWKGSGKDPSNPGVHGMRWHT